MPSLEDLRKPQQFVCTHLADAQFVSEGFRKTSIYRDLKLTEATHGAVKAHVIRNGAAFDHTAANAVEHAHVLDFHFVYMLKGWIKMRIGNEEITVSEGSAFLLPGGMFHTVLGYSDDRELLEIMMPSDVGTIDAPPVVTDASGVVADR